MAPLKRSPARAAPGPLPATPAIGKPAARPQPSTPAIGARKVARVTPTAEHLPARTEACACSATHPTGPSSAALEQCTRQCLAAVRERLGEQAAALARRVEGLSALIDHYDAVRAVSPDVTLCGLQDTRHQLSLLRARAACVAHASHGSWCALCARRNRVGVYSFSINATPCCDGPLCEPCRVSLPVSLATVTLGDGQALRIACHSRCPFCDAKLPPRELAVTALDTTKLGGCDSESEA